MKYTQSVGEKSTVKLTIDFSEEEWKDAISQAYLKTRAKYAVPGFRKGKVPKPVLENYYGKAVFYEEAFNHLYATHYFSIIDKERANFIAVGEPELSVDRIEEGKGVTLSAIVPVKPEVKIDAYKGLKIKKYEYNVTDADIENEVKRLLERKATDVEVTDRACQNGDTVNIDFSGSVDGEKFAGGTAEEYDLVLGSGSFIPGFESQVEGMKVGENRQITVKFPEDYQADNLKGKDAIFDIKLNKITAKQLPELTDEYVKANAGVETVDEFKAKAKERLARQAKDRSRDETENSIIEEICKHATAEIPQAMIETEIDRLVREFSQRLMYQGIKLEEYLKYTGQELKDFRAQFASQAQPRVMSQLVIDKIVREEKLTATEEEVEGKIAEQAASVEKSAEEYKKGMDPRQVDYIRNDIIITKLFELLMTENELYSDEPAEKPAAKKTTAKKPAEEGAEKPAAAKTTAKKPAEEGAKKPVAKKPAAKKPSGEKSE